MTSAWMWRAAGITALLDVALVLLLARRIRPGRFRELKWPLVISAGCVFGALWGIFPSGYFWQECYRLLFPGWARWVLPPVFSCAYGAVALCFWWWSRQLTGNSIVNFCLLGGAISLPGHWWAIYGRKMFEKCAILHAVSPASALVFGVFEFIFYWCVILSVAVALKRAREVWRASSGAG